MKTLIFFILFHFVSFSQSFNGNGGLIPDNGSEIEFPIMVSGLNQSQLNENLGIKQICLSITHTWVSDLYISLLSPDGTESILFNGIGGDGDNFEETCLTQEATFPINIQTAPFTGFFKPQQNLGNHNNGQNGNGIWKLKIIDTYPDADQGTLLNWSLLFENDAPIPFVFTSSNLPIILINTNNQNIVDEPSIVANMKIIDNPSNLPNTVTALPNVYNGKINIEYRGNFSQILPQKPYKIETLDAQENEQNVSIFGFPEEHDWCLLAMYNDKSFVRNALAYTLFEQMGHYATRHKLCEVVINNEYMGVFLFCETIKRDNDRVDIARLDPTENQGLDVTGGYILKNDFGPGFSLNQNPIDHPNLTPSLAYEYPKAELISSFQENYIQGFINDLGNALYSENFTDLNLGYRKYISITSFIDYFIINELSRNNDGFKKSVYFHKDKDNITGLSKLKAGPVWDFDWAWKNINECSIFAATDGSGWAYKVNDCNPDNTSVGWYVRLLQDEAFRNNLRCRWEFFRENVLSLNSLYAYIDEKALLLNEAQQRHFDRWGNLGINTGTPEIEPDPATFEGQILKLKDWIATRITWLDANIPGVAQNCILSVKDNYLENNLVIYPNPSNGLFTLTLDKRINPAKLEVYTLLGQKLYENKVLNVYETQLNLNHLDKGNYLLKISFENYTICKRLVVK